MLFKSNSEVKGILWLSQYLQVNCCCCLPLPSYNDSLPISILFVEERYNEHHGSGQELWWNVLSQHHKENVNFIPAALHGNNSKCPRELGHVAASVKGCLAGSALLKAKILFCPLWHHKVVCLELITPQIRLAATDGPHVVVDHSVSTLTSTDMHILFLIEMFVLLHLQNQ